MTPAVTLHEESPPSVAIDGARIGVYTAMALVMVDHKLPADLKAGLIVHLEEAHAWLDGARRLLPVETSSVHTVSLPQGPIIEVATR